jgi:hypothetical protein
MVNNGSALSVLNVFDRSMGIIDSVAIVTSQFLENIDWNWHIFSTNWSAPRIRERHFDQKFDRRMNRNAVMTNEITFPARWIPICLTLSRGCATMKSLLHFGGRCNLFEWRRSGLTENQWGKLFRHFDGRKSLLWQPSYHYVRRRLWLLVHIHWQLWNSSLMMFFKGGVSLQWSLLMNCCLSQKVQRIVDSMRSS